MGNNKGTEGITILIVENYLASGLSKVEYERITGVNRSSLTDKIKRYERISGKPLPEQATSRNEDIARKFKEDWDNGLLPIPNILPLKKVEKKVKSSENNEQSIGIEVKNHDIEEKQADQKKPGSKDLKTRYGLVMTEEAYEVIKAFSSIQQLSINQVIILALEDYMKKPENLEAYKDSKSLAQLMMKSRKKKGGKN